MIEAWLGCAPVVFLWLTLGVFGGCGWLTGQGMATRWRSGPEVLPYVLLLILGDRFLLWGLFAEEFTSLWGLVVHGAVLASITYAAFRMARARRMVSQYPWLYRRHGLFGWTSVGSQGVGSQGHDGRTGKIAAVLMAATATTAAAVLTAPGTRADDLPQFCRRLVAHQPDPGVGYVAGVDVRGQPVAPADLAPIGGPRPGGSVDTPLTPDLAQQLGYAVPGAARLPGTLGLGKLTVIGNQAYLDGRPLDGVDDSQLRALCQAQKR